MKLINLSTAICGLSQAIGALKGTECDGVVPQLEDIYEVLNDSLMENINMSNEIKQEQTKGE
ncbi:MAG: hypothetical protein J6S85_10485 [Methanobrevibacter sp.]|nr:hypothetical protein [Methanobrevibacter sp.]